MTANLLTTEIHFEPDIVLVRQRARQIAALIGFDTLEQTQIATAVSEIARNAYQYAGGGTVRYALTEGGPCRFQIQIADRGTGIADVQAILDGRYKSQTGLGRGILGAKRLMDHFEITSAPHSGTTVVLAKQTPAAFKPATGHVAQIVLALSQAAPQNPFQEVQNQNQELLRALEEGRMRQAEAERLNIELRETNRGVMALVAELDDKARALQLASEMKSRFLSNMGHEIRTPINAILSLSRLLLDRADGELTDEQARQVGFIRSSGEALAELVGDLLDIARIEAGKTVVRPREFTINDLWGALRGMFRPLHTDGSVTLIFEEPSEMPPFQTDEGRVAQILRNFISNALKFTLEGTVRVRVELVPSRSGVEAQARFTVVDTGIGIAAQDHERIFEEFAQLENGMQHHIKGTGLGLSLTRRLAHLLGGHVGVESAQGKGASFYALIPLVYAEQPADDAESEDAVGEASPRSLDHAPDYSASGQASKSSLSPVPLARPVAAPRSIEEGNRA